MVVLFQVPRCENKYCGLTKPCCSSPEPYEMKVKSYGMFGGWATERDALFCRSCGREITL